MAKRRGALQTRDRITPASMDPGSRA